MFPVTAGQSGKGSEASVRLRRFSGLSLRNLLARPQRTLLTTVGIVLGVGIVFGVLTLSETMSSSFSALYTRAYGAADLTVTAAGGNGTFDETLAGEVRVMPGVASAAPRLSRPATLLIEGERPEPRAMRIFGVDPETAALATGFELAAGRYPREGAELVLDVGSAEAAGIALGEKARVATAAGTEELTLVGTLRIPGGSFGGSAFGLIPLPFTQETFEKPQEITGIAVGAANPGEVDTLKEELSRRLGEGFQVERSETRTQQASSQLRTFQVALLFFAGTALFVGGFLVFNALSMTVLERTRELGMLRSLGATRAMISRSVVLEAATLGLAGSVMGVPLGYWMSRSLLALFGESLRLGDPKLALSPFALTSAIAVGVTVTVLAALYPALRAGRVSPVEAMRSQSAAPGYVSGGRIRLSRLTTSFGLLLVAAGGWWSYRTAKGVSFSTDGLAYVTGLAGVVAMFLGVALIVPALTRPLTTLLSAPLRLLLGVEGQMAAANAVRNRSRTALTASAVIVGVSVVVAFSALGGSVLGSIRSYLESSLGSDYIVQPANGNYGVTFSRELRERVSELPGVGVATGVGSDFRRTGEDVYLIFGLDESYPEVFHLNYSAGGPGAFADLRGGSAIVGEQLAESRKLGVGSTLTLPSPGGDRNYRIAGIVANDFLGGGTGIYLSREALAEDFSVTEDSLLAIKTASGTDTRTTGKEVRSLLEDYPHLALYSNAEYNEELQREFGQQYVFFYAIMGVSVAVSAFGVVNTLSMSIFERRREIGVLRAVGATRLQVGRLVVNEGVVISLIGCVIGLALGSVLGYLFVRGSAAAGFDVEFFYPTVPAALSLLAGLVIGVTAGLIPARSAAGTNIVEAVQYE